MDLQASLAILTTASNKPVKSPQTDSYGRKPFQNPALESLGALNEESKAQVMDSKRLAMLAERYGLPDVVRWKPKNVRRTISTFR